MVITYRKSNIKAQQSYVSEAITKYPISKNSLLTEIKIQSSTFPKKYAGNIHGKNTRKHK